METTWHTTFFQRCLRAVHTSYAGDLFHTRGAPSGECGGAVVQTIPSLGVAATFPGKEREKSLNCMQLVASGLGTPGPGSRVECPPQQFLAPL